MPTERLSASRPRTSPSLRSVVAQRATISQAPMPPSLPHLLAGL